MKTLPIALMSLLLGIAVTLAVSSMRMSSGHDSMTMAQMVNDLKGKSGDDLDKAFIEGMIVHHQGAIDMAKQVQTSAKHEEVRKLADDIIKAQTGEISQMRDWQKQWGYYPPSSQHKQKEPVGFLPALLDNQDGSRQSRRRLRLGNFSKP